jgi:hypothetical protein
MAEIITITASILMLINEFRNFSRNKIIEKFIIESHVIYDRIDAMEKTLVKLGDRL